MTNNPLNHTGYAATDLFHSTLWLSFTAVMSPSSGLPPSHDSYAHAHPGGKWVGLPFEESDCSHRAMPLDPGLDATHGDDQFLFSSQTLTVA